MCLSCAEACLRREPTHAKRCASMRHHSRGELLAFVDHLNLFAHSDHAIGMHEQSGPGLNAGLKRCLHRLEQATSTQGSQLNDRTLLREHLLRSHRREPPGQQSLAEGFIDHHIDVVTRAGQHRVGIINEIGSGFLALVITDWSLNTCCPVISPAVVESARR